MLRISLVRRDPGAARGRTGPRGAAARRDPRLGDETLSRRGLRASLREIADDASVNLGLIHRHFGNKHDLVDAVLARQRERGREAIADTSDDQGASIRRMFELSARNDDDARIVAWLALAGHRRPETVDGYPTITAVRNAGPTNVERDRRLMAAMTLLYGWALFRDEVLQAFGCTEDERATVEDDLAVLIERLVRGVDADAP